MIPQTGFAPSALDINMSRAIEELAYIVNDVEQRVQLVKLGLAQSFPQLASGLNVGRPTLGSLPLGALPFGTLPTASSLHAPLVLAPYLNNGVWPTPQTIPTQIHPGLGVVFAPGVTSPFSGFPASLSPFR